MKNLSKRNNYEKGIPIDKVRETNGEQTLSNAIKNIKRGVVPLTKGKILVEENTDGTYTIGDGFHRVAEAILRGDKTILADVGTHISDALEIYRRLKNNS